MDYRFNAQSRQIQSADDVVEFLGKKLLHAHSVFNMANFNDCKSLPCAPANMSANCEVRVKHSGGEKTVYKACVVALNECTREKEPKNFFGTKTIFKETYGGSLVFENHWRAN